MHTVNVGYRQLFDCLGCSLAEGDEVRIQTPYSEQTRVEVYLGPNPRFGLANFAKGDKYLIPGEQSALMGPGTYSRNIAETHYPRYFFLEVIAFKQVEIDQEVFDAFLASTKEGKESVLSLAEESRLEFMEAVDLISGTFGLLFTRQFILELLNENLLATSEGEHSVIQFVTDPVEKLDRVSLKGTGVESIRQLISQLTTVEAKVKARAATSMKWLMKAWRERDQRNRFLALFIPLEVILNQYAAPRPNFRKQTGKVRQLLRDYAGVDSQELLSFFNHLVQRQRPSLVDRFEAFASTTMLPGWEHDLEAFKKFNQIRNAILHRGEYEVTLRVEITKEITLELQDLTQRYLRLALFSIRN